MALHDVNAVITEYADALSKALADEAVASYDKAEKTRDADEIHSHVTAARVLRGLSMAVGNAALAVGRKRLDEAKKAAGSAE